MTIGTICIVIIIFAFSQPSFGQEPATLTAKTRPPDVESNFNKNVSYGEMLALYKEILETNKWTTTIFLAVLTATGVGALYLYQKGMRGISELQMRINEFKVEMEKNINEYENLKALGIIMEDKIKLQVSTMNDIDKSLNGLKLKVKLLQSELTECIPRIETLAQVDTYSIRLFSEKKKDSIISKKTLIELSKDNDPVVRCKCIQAFNLLAGRQKNIGRIDTANKAIIDRLKWLKKNDPENGVRLEAKRALETFN